jgi:hypothetical protein
MIRSHCLLPGLKTILDPHISASDGAGIMSVYHHAQTCIQFLAILKGSHFEKKDLAKSEKKRACCNAD